MNISSLFDPEILKEDPERIIGNVNFNVNFLVEEIILKEPSRPIYRVGRKSHHLIIHLNDRLSDMGFIPLSVRNYSSATIVDDIKEGIETYVFCDSIHSGSEIIRTLKILSKRVKVIKIFSYLCSIKGINNLINSGYKREDLICLFSYESDEDYKREFDKLRVYYLHRIEPINIDLLYDMYLIRDYNNIKEIFNMCKTYVEHLFGFKSMPFIDKSLRFPKDIFQIIYTIDDKFTKNINVKKNVNAIKYKNIQNIDIKFKFKTTKYDTFFTITPVIQMNSVKYSLKNKRKKCLYNIKHCQYEEIIIEEYNNIIDVARTTCSWCIEKNISEIILNDINKNIQKYLLPKNINITRTRTYRP